MVSEYDTPLHADDQVSGHDIYPTRTVETYERRILCMSARSCVPDL
jgi:hypothetical protein